MVLGISEPTLCRWIAHFQATGNVNRKAPQQKTSQWPRSSQDFVGDYVKQHPCFCFEELRLAVQDEFPDVLNVSDATMCRVLCFDLGLSRKKLAKRARESVPAERSQFVFRLAPFYSESDQLIFVNETSKDGRSMMRHHAQAPRNEPAVV